MRHSQPLFLGERRSFKSPSEHFLPHAPRPAGRQLPIKVPRSKSLRCASAIGGCLSLALLSHRNDGRSDFLPRNRSFKCGGLNYPHLSRRLFSIGRCIRGHRFMRICLFVGRIIHDWETVSRKGFAGARWQECSARTLEFTKSLVESKSIATPDR
jgi:hypothetical protein